MDSKITEIILRIEEILANKQGVSIDYLGSYIVGATLARDDYEELAEACPQLTEVAELGATLETLANSPTTADEVLSELRREFDKLKSSPRR